MDTFVETVSFDNPFYNQLSEYPVRFAQPVFFGESPLLSYSAKLHNGTVTLLRFQNLFVGVTCQHVLAGYREAQMAGEEIMFQIGHYEIDPEQYLISEDRVRDLVTFDLTPLVGKGKDLNEASFVEPVRWPPSEVSEEDVICLAGFPGIWREQMSLGRLRFYSFSSGANEVHSVREDHIVTRIQVEQCIAKINDAKVLGSLGGLSGGPVFAWRKERLLHAEIIGFIYEYQDSLDLMYIRTANVLNQDGTFV
jgi:hypothetical protein